MHKDFLNEGLIIDEKDVDFVVVGDAGNDFIYEKMNKAFRAVIDGAEIIAMEKDRYWLGDDNKLTLSAGPYVSALEYATGIGVNLRIWTHFHNINHPCCLLKLLLVFSVLSHSNFFIFSPSIINSSISSLSS